MELTHEFTVPATVEETWEVFNDIEGVAGCFPGAVVTSMEGDVFTGSCKVKLGPIALVYNGSGTFLEKDEQARTMTIQAKGKDKRGNGTAGADVVVTMTAGDRGTRVVVVTDLAITGKPAQFGRGVIQDVSDKLLAQFVDCLETRVGDAGEPSQEEPEQGTGTPAQVAAAPAARPAAPRAAPPQRDDSLDLGAAVVPVLLRTYGKQVAGLALLLLVIWLVRRRR
ncbi:SRPBCC family protein [Nocardioides sp.]|uniref:SRPBCC family protein n=1 Tax=Nocardioides sp. TaxID=35761 RepID=UPI0027330F7B|nr:SRPBCC family protein [Nocardioides sp.]MDP3891275.1 SRPBCC family protein [Nocardioides sp.]